MQFSIKDLARADFFNFKYLNSCKEWDNKYDLFGKMVDNFKNYTYLCGIYIN